MRKPGTIVKRFVGNLYFVAALILLVIALSVTIGFVIILSCPIPPVHPAEQIPTVGGTYVIDGRVYLVCDANQHSGAAGATVYRGKVFMLFDPNEPPAPPDPNLLEVQQKSSRKTR